MKGNNFIMETMDAIYNRRSTRKFKDTPLTEAQIETLLKAGFSAPTAADTRPREFIVTTDVKILEEIRNAMYFARFTAPCVITVCGNMKLAFKGPDKDLWIEDCSASIENILLAATDMGIGSLWVGVYPIESKVKAVRKLLDIPDYVIPLALIYLGYADSPSEGRFRYDAKRVYTDKYDPNRKHRKKDKELSDEL